MMKDQETLEDTQQVADQRTILEKQIKLFNSVVVEKKEVSEQEADIKNEIRAEETLPYGFIITPEVASHPEVNDIIDICKKEFIDGGKANSTFHKSWGKIKDSSRKELAVEQILHYFSTYGLRSMGLFDSDKVYIPNEELDIPEVKGDEISLFVIKGIEKNEMVEKCMNLIGTNIALNEETIDDVIEILDHCEYEFNDLSVIKNKDAKMRVMDKKGIVPDSADEMVRFLVYKATGRSIVIKSNEALREITMSGLSIKDQCKKIGLEKMAERFYRYKEIFLSFKKANPENISTVNKIRKLAKKHHRPMKSDVLNELTSLKTFSEGDIKKRLDKVNNYRKMKILYAIHIRLTDTKSLVYKIRNGKAFAKPRQQEDGEEKRLKKLYDIVYSHLVESMNISGQKIIYPDNVEYALPVSEKQFVGNFPFGTSVEVNKDLVAGIYWENDYGARDLDLSVISNEKIGWNARFGNDNNTMLYSGDNTDASKGASEAFYIRRGVSSPQLLINNVFSGSKDCKFKLFVSNEKLNGDEDFNRNYMVDPNKMIVQTEARMPQQKQSVLGFFIPTTKGTKFVMTNFSTGNVPVSTVNEISNRVRGYFFHFYSEPIKMRDVLNDAGAEFVENDEELKNNEENKEEEIIDLRPESISKDTILNLFNNEK